MKKRGQNGIDEFLVDHLPRAVTDILNTNRKLNKNASGNQHYFGLHHHVTSEKHLGDFSLAMDHGD